MRYLESLFDRCRRRSTTNAENDLAQPNEAISLDLLYDEKNADVETKTKRRDDSLGEAKYTRSQRATVDLGRSSGFNHSPSHERRASLPILPTAGSSHPHNNSSVGLLVGAKKLAAKVWNTPILIYPLLSGLLGFNLYVIPDLWDEHFAEENARSPNSYRFYAALWFIVSTAQLLFEKHKKQINTVLQMIFRRTRRFEFISYELMQGISDIALVFMNATAYFYSNEYSLAKVIDVGMLSYFSWNIAHQIVAASPSTTRFSQLGSEYAIPRASKRQIIGLLAASASLIVTNVILDTYGDDDLEGAAKTFAGLARDFGTTVFGFALGRIIMNLRNKNRKQVMSPFLRRLLIFMLSPSIQTTSLRVDLRVDFDNAYPLYLITGLISCVLYVEYDIQGVIQCETKNKILSATEEIQKKYPAFYPYLNTLGVVIHNSFDVKNLIYDSLLILRLISNAFFINEFPAYLTFSAVVIPGVVFIFRLNNWLWAPTQSPAKSRLKQLSFRFLSTNLCFLAPATIYAFKLYMTHRQFNHQPLIMFARLPDETIPLNTTRSFIYSVLFGVLAAAGVGSLRSLRNRRNLVLGKNTFIKLEVFRLAHCTSIEEAKMRHEEKQATLKLSQAESFAIFKALYELDTFDGPLLSAAFNLPPDIPRFTSPFRRWSFFTWYGSVFRRVELDSLLVESEPDYDILEENIRDFNTFGITITNNAYLSARGEDFDFGVIFRP